MKSVTYTLLEGYVIKIIYWLRHGRSGLLAIASRILGGVLLLLLLRSLVITRTLTATLLAVAGIALITTAAIQHLHLAVDVHHDFRGVTILTILPLPFAGLQSALDIDLGAFTQILGGNFRELSKNHNFMPFGFGHHLARLSIFVAFVGSQVEIGYRIATWGVSGFRILTQVADQNDFIYATRHTISP